MSLDSADCYLSTAHVLDALSRVQAAEEMEQEVDIPGGCSDDDRLEMHWSWCRD